jgi:hypothetical protein
VKVDRLPVRVIARPECTTVLVELRTARAMLILLFFPSSFVSPSSTVRTSSENTSSYFSPSSPVRV